MNAAITKIKQQKSVTFVDWCPTGFKVGIKRAGVLYNYLVSGDLPLFLVNFLWYDTYLRVSILHLNNLILSYHTRGNQILIKNLQENGIEISPPPGPLSDSGHFGQEVNIFHIGTQNSIRIILFYKGLEFFNPSTDTII